VDHFSWNYTTYLNLIFLPIFALLFVLYRSGARGDTDDRFARDPVCGMQVVADEAPASVAHAGAGWFFCSERCAQRFTEDPDRFTDRVGSTQ
jgi:uncharacterized protein